MRAVVYQSFFGSRNLSKFLRFGFSGTAKSKPETMQKIQIKNSMNLDFRINITSVPQNNTSIHIRRGQK